MEMNPSPSEVVASHGSPGHDEQQVHQQQTRSYECNFCKKGFSNAQALGGHMNIHRKDKAKLKQANSRSSSTKTLDVTSGRGKLIIKGKAPAKWVPCIYSSSDHDHHHHILHESSYVYPRDGSHVAAELKQLPLFVDTTRLADNYSNPIIHHASSEELDLELRLGHKPPKSSLSSFGTRKFF